LAKEKDLIWEKVKKEVDLRDKRQCQLARCLSISESHQLKIDGPKIIDRCHIYSRSSYPELIYNKNNIVTLSRYIHRRMDDFKDPIYGNNISIEEHFYWWWRIKNHKIEKFNEEINYEELLLEGIKCC
jgi:hypothetical protein